MRTAAGPPGYGGPAALFKCGKSDTSLSFCRAAVIVWAMAKRARRPEFQDRREIANYGIPEAAHYLRVAEATLRSWVLGFRPLIRLAQREPPLLSFINLVEAHVLDAIRHHHRRPLRTVRRALEYVAREFGSRHPLAQQQFETVGVNLFIQRVDLKSHLKRIEHDEAGLAIRLYPFTRPNHAQQPRVVVIDPRMSFGRPVIAGTGIATTAIAERYVAGESMVELAKDYGRELSEIEEAVRCELRLEAA